jgi:hypothetical protein
MNSKAVLPASPLGQRLTEIFTYGWKWISMELDNLFTAPEWKTNQKYPLRPRVLWKKYNDAAEVIGVRFGSKTRYAMLDIDANSDYIEAIGGIRGALETVGIVRTITIRSSYSGGLHLYTPLPQDYPTFSVACLLQQCLEAQGFRLAPGQLEAFPNVKGYAKTWLGEYSEYNGHRLPLQPGTGSCILDDDLQPINGATELSRFFASWDNAVLLNDHAEISEALCVARANRRHRNRGKSSKKIEEWKADLQAVIEEGWTGQGQTNGLLKDIACYGVVFEGLRGPLLAEFVTRTANEAPGVEQYCQHLYELDRRCFQWAAAAEKFWWPLGDDPLRERPSFMNVCKERAEEARLRIQRAVNSLALVGMNVKARVEALCQEAKCSASTLYKNKDLWHPGHQDGDQDSLPVTPHQTDDITDPAEALRLLREGLGSPDSWGVTGKGGNNEACILKSLPLKNLTPGGREGGRGGREGLSTGPASTGWLPPLDWIEGAVDDV